MVAAKGVRFCGASRMKLSSSAVLQDRLKQETKETPLSKFKGNLSFVLQVSAKSLNADRAVWKPSGGLLLGLSLEVLKYTSRVNFKRFRNFLILGQRHSNS